MAKASVRVVGADQALKALRSLEPTVARQVGRDISDVGRDIMAERAAAVAVQAGPVGRQFRHPSADAAPPSQSQQTQAHQQSPVLLSLWAVA